MADEQAIRARAHALWEAEGRPEGRDTVHWEQARLELEQADPFAIVPDGATVDGGPESPPVAPPRKPRASRAKAATT
ncbi:MAG: DUF2934 domain-containing protein [Sphingobium sp.]